MTTPLTDAEIESIEDDHGCSLPLCPCCVCDLVADIKWLRTELDRSELGFQEMFKDLAKARAEIKKLNERNIK